MVHSKKKKPTEDITQNVMGKNVMGKNLYQQVQLNNFLLIFYLTLFKIQLQVNYKSHSLQLGIYIK